ncbi:MAG TPA: CotH kinase family protein [Anaerolineae bacterium]|nr:CotH kinase family protein [Anaerolineae bacterium]
MKIGKRRREWPGGILAWLGVLVLLFVLGLAVSDAEWNLASGDLWASWDRLFRPAAGAADLPTLVVDMPFASYDDLLGHREQALRDGVYVPSEQDFVNATIRVGDSVVPVRMRLLEGPADHLAEGGKWGLEVRTRQNQQLLGLQRFYLQDPADNNWLGQWAFARALERAGVLVARYQFVHLVFNGDTWGIYALQEGFGNELLTAQGRREGVIVRFDADLLWASIAHFGGDAQATYTDPVANLSAADFRFFEVDTFRDTDIDRDPELAAQRERALAMLRALQAGEAAASEVLDVEQYGRFLALVDLWAATEATSLVNLRYYYNADSGRLEPIGFDAGALGSRARLSLAATHGDPVLQAAYAQEALRVSQPEYVAQLRAELEPELRRLRQAVAPEHQDEELLWDELYERQELIRRSLNPVQPVLAYLGPAEMSSDGIVRVYVGNVLNLPVEIVGFDIHGATVLPANGEWLQDEPTGLLTGSADQIVLRAFAPAQVPVIRYVRFDVPLAEIHRVDAELDLMQALDVQVITRILGLSTTQMTLAQEGYPDAFVAGGS